MSDHTQLQIEEDRSDSARMRFVLQGRINIGIAQSFYEKAISLVSSKKNIAVICDQVEYLDISAIQILIAFGQSVLQQGNDFEFSGVSQDLKQVLRVSGFDSGN